MSTAQPAWSIYQPTVTGWYWRREKYVDGTYSEPRIINVIRIKEGKSRGFSEWAGPLSPPPTEPGGTRP